MLLDSSPRLRSTSRQSSLRPTTQRLVILIMNIEACSSPNRRQGWAGRLRDEVMFRLRTPDWDEVISPELTFGERANSRFLELLRSSRSYLEFGAGSSTLQVARAGLSYTTVESDVDFLAAVERKCGPGEGTFILADIGSTGLWGVPRRRRPRRERVIRWQGYPLAPWRTLGADFRADTVLVDGRFRVACVLAMVLYQNDFSWTLLFDDYGHRPEYAEVEDYATLVGWHGQMAEFVPKAGVDKEKAASAFERYSADWR